MKAGVKLEKNIHTPELEKLPKNPEEDFEFNDERGLEKLKDKTVHSIEGEALKTKEDGVSNLNQTLHSYDLPDEEVASIREESQVDANLKSNSEEIDELASSTAEQIKSVGEVSKSEQSQETQEGDIEKERTIESFQEKRGTIITNLLTSETVNNGLNLVPFAGGGKMLVESISGKELSGKKLTGKQRIIHGAIGAGSLALDFTGIGEVSKAGVFAGRSVGLIEKVGLGLAEKGAVRSARVFQKTAEFMAKHPELTAKAESYADNKIRGVVTKIKDYKRGVRAVDGVQDLESVVEDPQTPEGEVFDEKKEEIPKEEIPQDTENTEGAEINIGTPEKVAEQELQKDVVAEQIEPIEEGIEETEADQGIDENNDERFREKITNPEAKDILEKNSEKFNNDAEEFRLKVEQIAVERELKISDYKENLTEVIDKIRKTKEELRYLSDQIEADEKEVGIYRSELGEYASEAKKLDESIFSKFTKRKELSDLKNMAGNTETIIQYIQERVQKNNIRKAELTQKIQEGDLASKNLPTEQREALVSFEQQVGSTMTDADPNYKKTIDQIVQSTTQKHFFGQYGEFADENREIISELTLLKNELSFGVDSSVNLVPERDLDNVREQATRLADERLNSELKKYNEEVYKEMASRHSRIEPNQNKTIEEVKQEVLDGLRKSIWEKTYKSIYSSMSNQYSASMQLIGLKESDVNKYLEIESEVKSKLGIDFENTTKKNFEYARYRAYYEARRTGQNIFTHVTSGERATQIIEQHALKSSKITTPEDKRRDKYDLQAMGQTSNIEENIYFTSGGGGFDYGTKIVGGSIVKKSVSDFVFFAATGNDILASGRSVEVAEPSMSEKGESLRGRAVGDYESANGTELPLDNLQIVVAESQIERYTKLLEQNGYEQNFAQEHLIGIPDEIIKIAIDSGGGVPMRDSKVLHDYMDSQLRKQIRNRSKNKDKIFASVATRGSRDPVSKGGSHDQVLKWVQIN